MFSLAASGGIVTSTAGTRHRPWRSVWCILVKWASVSARRRSTMGCRWRVDNTGPVYLLECSLRDAAVYTLVELILSPLHGTSSPLHQKRKETGMYLDMRKFYVTYVSRNIEAHLTHYCIHQMGIKGCPAILSCQWWLLQGRAAKTLCTQKGQLTADHPDLLVHPCHVMLSFQ